MGADPAPTMSAPPATTRWLYGPVRDLLFGAGLVYVVAFVALAVDGDGVRRAIPFEWTPLLVLVTGLPHYGATMLRALGRSEDRRRYGRFTLGVAAVLGAWLFGGLHDAALGGLLVTVYLTWSPYHYSGQNYGIALAFLRRRGVAVDGGSRRWLRVSFVASFLLTAVMLHAVDPAVSYAPADYGGTPFRLYSLGLPSGVVDAAMVGLGVAWAGSIVAAGVGLARTGARLVDLGPTFALVGSQALWFAVPALCRYGDLLQGVEPLGTEHATYAFLWVAMTHAVQYLWITSFYARRDGGGSDPVWRYAAACVAIGAALWVVPAVLFAPGLLGRLPYDAGLGLLVASAVNLHHFVLDGVLWKLRDGRVARVLLGDGGGAADRGAAAESPRAWLRRAGWVAGVASILVWIVSTSEQARGLKPGLAAGDLATVEASLERLSWIGQDSARVRASLARLHLDAGDAGAAALAVAAAERLAPTAATLFDLSTVAHRAGDGELAITFAERAVAARPEDARFAHRAAWLLVRYGATDPVRVSRAVALATMAVAETERRDASHLHTLALATAATGRVDDALRIADEAARVAHESDNPRLVELILRTIDDLYAKRPGGRR